MKILVREINDGICNYVWKKMASNRPITKRCGTVYYKTEDNKVYDCLQIVKITHDYRKLNYVLCSNCGEVVKESKLIQHYEAQEHNANCMKCDRLLLKKANDSETTNVLRPDGTVLSKTVNNAYCNDRYGWRYIPLAEVNKLERCKYFACRRSEKLDIISDFWSNYQNPYKDILTEAGVIKGKWRYIDSHRGRRYANSNGKVIACFDTNGILENFVLLHRNNSEEFVYSDVYDKFFGRNGLEFNWSDIAEASKERYMRQIRALYK